MSQTRRVPSFTRPGREDGSGVLSSQCFHCSIADVDITPFSSSACCELSSLNHHNKANTPIKSKIYRYNPDDSQVDRD